ncbi:hypothetical protein H6P81_010257 [Aristolochia fimbriata]|uniref:Uncharacterized protein n=1 Tax=Aristolochia fimbriata TaxID=158543 RepID=A0AAV7EN91_ARIFI|nr:hypothetical protein H6P81_010257 [Aristolochia fimbriata]
MAAQIKGFEDGASLIEGRGGQGEDRMRLEEGDKAHDNSRGQTVLHSSSSKRRVLTRIHIPRSASKESSFSSSSCEDRVNRKNVIREKSPLPNFSILESGKKLKVQSHSDRLTMLTAYNPPRKNTTDSWVELLSQYQGTCLEARKMKSWHWVKIRWAQGQGSRRKQGSTTMIIASWNLEEIPTSGKVYTWSNGQRTPILSKLDIFLATGDHWLNRREGSWGRKPFRFENWWLQEEEIEGLLKSWWERFSVQGPIGGRVAIMLKLLKGKLIGWAKLKKAANAAQRTLLRSQVDGLDELEEGRPLSTSEFDDRVIASRELKSIVAHERIIWKQRARYKWLKEVTTDSTSIPISSMS